MLDPIKSGLGLFFLSDGTLSSSCELCQAAAPEACSADARVRAQPGSGRVDTQSLRLSLFGVPLHSQAAVVASNSALEFFRPEG